MNQSTTQLSLSLQRQKWFFLLFCVGGSESECEKKEVRKEEGEKFMSLAILPMDGMNGMESTKHFDKNVFHSEFEENFDGKPRTISERYYEIRNSTKLALYLMEIWCQSTYFYWIKC